MLCMQKGCRFNPLHLHFPVLGWKVTEISYLEIPEEHLPILIDPNGLIRHKAVSYIRGAFANIETREMKRDCKLKLRAMTPRGCLYLIILLILAPGLATPAAFILPAQTHWVVDQRCTFHYSSSLPEAGNEDNTEMGQGNHRARSPFLQTRKTIPSN